MRKKIIIIFLSAVFLRLFFGVFWYINDRPFYNASGDGPSYIQTANNLVEKGIWSSDPDNNPKPDNFRTPAYPLFLSVFLKFNIPFDYIAIIQGILMAVSAVLIYFLGRRLFNESVAFWTGFIFAIHPYLASSFVSSAILTEVFAVFLLIISFFGLAIYIKERENKFLVIGSVFLALAALTKPQFLIFLFFMPIAALLSKDKFLIKTKKVLLCFLIYFILISPWLYYNFFVLKVHQFSSVPSVSVYIIAGYFQESLKGGHGQQFNDFTFEQAKRITSSNNDAQLFEPHNAKTLAKLGTDFIKTKLFSFAYYHITRIPRIFYHDTTVETLSGDLNGSQNLKPGEMDINVIKNIWKGNFSAAKTDLLQHPSWFLSLFLKAITLLLAILAIINFFLVWKFTGQISQVSLFFLLFIISFGAMASPVGQQRYRVPIEPFILILAFDSIKLIYQKSKSFLWQK